MNERRASNYASCAPGANKTFTNSYAVGTTLRPKMFGLIIGCGLSTSDQASIFYVQRTTALGTPAGTITPASHDPSFAMSNVGMGYGAYSAEPTYTASTILMQIPLNQRYTYHWQAFEGCELVIPATANNGLGVKTLSTTSSQDHQVTQWILE